MKHLGVGQSAQCYQEKYLDTINVMSVLRGTTVVLGFKLLTNTNDMILVTVSDNSHSN